ncbi:MAG: hypothetical protein JWM09_1423 [Francisellaceae bacterium]|nr:hypothetical protein [Francisellaceae bacterium]
MLKKKENNSILNKKIIFAAASQMANIGKMPTIKDIRELLGGKGSETTLHKYLDLWKKELLKCALKLEYINDYDRDKIEKLSTEKLTLEKALELQISKNKIMADELMQKEKENFIILKENTALNENLEELTAHYKNLIIKHEASEKNYQNLKNEREYSLDKILNDKNAHIERLNTELKEMHQCHFNLIQNKGRHSDELIMKEKLKNIYLSDEIQALKREIQSLQLRAEKAEKAKAPLQIELKRQQALIQKFISWEQLKSYQPEPSEKS